MDPALGPGANVAETTSAKAARSSPLTSTSTSSSTTTPPTKHLWKRPRLHLHFTPTSGSWLNGVERWFGLLTQRAIKRGAHLSTKELEAAIMTYLASHNAEDAKPFVWTKTADDILASIARFAARTHSAHAAT